jgi:peroxiredoxin Q/BCP
MKVLWVLTAILALAAFGTTGAEAQDLQVGDDAPAFDLPGSDGNTHSLAQYAGRTVVLAWFPKAFTGG